MSSNKVEEVAVPTAESYEDPEAAKKTRRSSSKRHSFYSAIPITRRMQEGAWGKNSIFLQKLFVTYQLRFIYVKNVLFMQVSFKNEVEDPLKDYKIAFPPVSSVDH